MTSESKNEQRFPYEPDWATEPGDVLQETMTHLEITPHDLAQRMSDTAQHIHELIGGQARINPETATRLEQVTPVPARFWTNLESQFQRRTSPEKRLGSDD